MTSALTAIWLLAIPGHWLPAGSDTGEVVLLIGIAVLDATIVRGIVLPAAMTLLGDRCCYLPRRLNWLYGSSRNQCAARPLPRSARQSRISDDDGSTLPA